MILDKKSENNWKKELMKYDKELIINLFLSKHYENSLITQENISLNKTIKDLNEVLNQQILEKQSERKSSLEVIDQWKTRFFDLSAKYYNYLFDLKLPNNEINYIQCWNKLERYLMSSIEIFEKRLKTELSTFQLEGKLWFAENVLKTMKEIEKGEI